MRREPVTTEARIDFHMYPGRTADPPGRLLHPIDDVQGTDSQIDVGANEVIQGGLVDVVHPGQYPAPVRTDTRPSKMKGLTGLGGSEPCGTSRERSQGGRYQTVTVSIGLDHTHDLRTGPGLPDPADQLPHVGLEGCKVDDDLAGISLQGLLVVISAGIRREVPGRCCIQTHGTIVRQA